MLTPRPSAEHRCSCCDWKSAALILTATVVYARTGASGRLYAALFLVPDLSFLDYLAGPRIGAIAYNAAHTTLGPIVLALVGIGTGATLMIAVALIWEAHVGFDRMLGYGLKYADGFSFTHLGRIGRASGAAKP